MSVDLISILLGAGLALFGVLVGAPVALLLRKKPESEADPYTCGCAHALAHHDPETNRCHVSVEVQKYNQYNERAGRERQPCACRQYVGERPIDPEALLDRFIETHPVIAPAPPEGPT